ncbi:MAG: hypothetical protein ACOX2F_04145 [bacterium]
MKKKIIIAVIAIFIAIFALLVFISNKESENEAEKAKVEEAMKTTIQKQKLLNVRKPKLHKELDKESLRKLIKASKAKKDNDNAKKEEEEEELEQTPENEK